MDENASSVGRRSWSGSTSDPADEELAMGPKRYRIVVAGELSCRFAPAFDGMTVHCGGGQTEITGMVVDQSQLHGLLDRVGELGLELVSVNAIEDRPVDPLLRRGGAAGSQPAEKGVR
jgi:hypothetical protein